MGSPARQIESKAMKLSPQERARLADRLLDSLQSALEDGVDRNDIEHRIDALRRGDSAWLESHIVVRT